MTSRIEWTGAVGDSWAAEWRRTDRSFAGLAPHLDAAILSAAPRGPFRALDIGFGAGGTSIALAQARDDATIVAVDVSPELTAVARWRLADLPARDDSATVTVVTGDVVTVAPDHAPFDLMYSRHGVMFFDDPVAAFATLRAAARPDAALIFSCFAAWEDNDFAHAIARALGAPPPVVDAPGPFAFADPLRVARLLDLAGWRDAACTAVPFQYRAGAGDDPVADALSFFQRIGPAAPVIRAVSGMARDALLEELAAVIAAHHVAGAIDFSAHAWIWSARA